MKYIREQQDTYTPGGYHRADSFIEIRVRFIEQSSREGYYVIKGYRPDDAANATLARFDTKAEAEAALEELIASILDPGCDQIIAPWPLEYVSIAKEEATK